MKRIFLSALLLLAAPFALAGIELLPGSAPQTAAVGTFFPNLIKARITDAQGAPIANYYTEVSYLIGVVTISGDLTCIPNDGRCTGRTDADGIISVRATALAVGPANVSFTGGGGYVYAKLTVVPSAPLPKVEVTGGADQVLLSGGTGAPFQFHVTRGGQPAPGVRVEVRQVLGPPLAFLGAADVVTVTTDDAGNARTPEWRIPAGIGSGDMLVWTPNDASGGIATADLRWVVKNAAGLSYVPYQPLWWGGPGQSGWGLAMPQHGESLFPVYFHYDETGRPTWDVLTGSWRAGAGGLYAGDLAHYQGSPYYAFDTTKVKVAGSVGATLSFDGANAAVLGINTNTSIITPPPPQFSLPVAPFSFTPAVKRAALGVSDIWWGGPSQSGWGISIAEDQGNLFLAWYTYESDGKPIWFSMPEGAWTDASTWKGAIYRTSGSSQVGAGYNPGMYQATKVGDFTIRFTGTSTATFDYAIDSHAGTLQLQRFTY